MELLARHKIAKRDNQSIFEDNELEQTFETEYFDQAMAFEASIEHYIKQPVFGDDQWNYTHELDCLEWYNKTLQDFREWTPLDRDILSVEQYFRLELPWKWAKYDYNGKTGQLSIQGTMDLLLIDNDDTLEYIDYKTGSTRKDFATGEIKDYEYFKHDTQLLLYYYAIRQLYPQYKNFKFTVLYIRAGGPFSVDFDDSDLKEAEKKFKDYFDKIRATNKPTNIQGDFRCKFCPYKTQIFKGNKTYCEFFHDEIQKYGVKLVTQKYVQKDVGSYSGGGKTNRSY